MGGNISIGKPQNIVPSHGNDVSLDFIQTHCSKDITAFTLIAKSSNNRIPTRVNHQLNYGEHGNKNPLKCSINVSLINEKMFVPKKRESFVWGQFIKHKNYTSKIGFCFSF